VQLESHSEVVADVFLAVVRGYIVHLSVKVEGQNVPLAGVHREVGQGKVRGSLEGSCNKEYHVDKISGTSFCAAVRDVFLIYIDFNRKLDICRSNRRTDLCYSKKYGMHVTIMFLSMPTIHL
jgi:hypothetical protein